MFCRKCGNEIPEGSEFCPKCGERIITEEIEKTAADAASSTVILEKTAEVVSNTTISADVAVLPQKKKKLKVILISIGALVAVLAVVFLAVILPEMHLEFYYERDSETRDYIILGTENDVKELNIPDTIWFIPVRAINDEAFKNSSVESVSFGSNVAEIGERAFDSCTKLKSVEFRGSYENSDIDTVSIGTGAFYNCSSLSDLTFPRINTIVGDGAFYKCKSLKRVYLDSVSRIGQIAFSESGLTSLDVDCNVGMAAFGKCTDLNNVKISSWAILESNVFEG